MAVNWRIAAVVAILATPVLAREVAGIGFPETRQAGGVALRLNGAGVRLYSVFRVQVYAAALYLERPGGGAEAVLRSAQTKLIEVHALRAVAAEAEAFVGAVQPSAVGAVETYLFGPGGLHVALNGRPAGAYGPGFAHLVLSTFIGASPPTEALKQALLAGPS